MSDDLLNLAARYDAQQDAQALSKPNKAISWDAFLQQKTAGQPLLVEEFNALRSEYSETYAPIFAKQSLGERPKRGVQEYDASFSEKKQEFESSVEQFVPRRDSNSPEHRLADRRVTADRNQLTLKMSKLAENTPTTSPSRSMHTDDFAGSAGSALVGMFVKGANLVDENGAAKFALTTHAPIMMLGVGTWWLLKRKPVNPKKWQPVDIATAKTNPLYGLGLWLWVFALGCVIGFMMPLAQMSETYRMFGGEGGRSALYPIFTSWPDSGFYQFGTCINFAGLSLILYLLFTKHKYFRPTATAYLLLAGPLYLVSLWIYGGDRAPYPLVSDFNGWAALFVAWPISCAIWISYLNLSKRVRITYENLVTRDTNDLWQRAYEESEGESRDVTLWAKCLVSANGDTDKTKAAYIKQRVNDLAT